MDQADKMFEEFQKHISVSSDTKRHKITNVATQRYNSISKGKVDISLNAVLLRKEYLDTGQILKISQPIYCGLGLRNGQILTSTQKIISQITQV